MDNERTHLEMTELDGEEQLTLVTIDHSKGTVTRTVGPMTETEFREEFQKRGMPKSEIDVHIGEARIRLKQKR